MSVEIIGIICLAVVFALSALRGFNMGALALVAAFILGVVYLRLPVGDVLKGFPGGLFVVLLGVTFLFGIARANGTVDWLVTAALGVTRNHTGAIPWVLFLLATALAAAGAASPAAVAIVAPIGIECAVRHRINPLYAGLMAVNGAAAGSFSPVGILGGVVTTTLAKHGMSVDAVALFEGTFAFNAVLCVVVWVVFGRQRSETEPVEAAASSPDSSINPTGVSKTAVSSVAVQSRPARGVADTRTRLHVEQMLTLVGIGVLVAASTIFALDAGFSALTVAAVLALLYPSSARRATADIAWPVILMVCGIVTYISLLENQGIVDSLARTVTLIGIPLLAGLVILYIGGVVSAFASTTAILGALVPLSIPLLGSAAVSTTGLLIALCVAATVVDASPFSTNGALVIANTPEERRVTAYRGLLIWGAAMTAVAPVTAWLIFVVL